MTDAMKASIVGNVFGALLTIALLALLERYMGRKLDLPGAR